MKRRVFMGFAAGAAASTILGIDAALAQQPPQPIIGFLSTVSPGPFAGELAAFKKGLAEAGFVEGQNVAIEYRWANNDIKRLPELAADLVKRNVNVLVAGGGSPSVLAGKAATTTIPVLFTGAGDPVRLGLVQSLNRPGGNVTGVSFVAVALVAKRVELLRELLPQSKLVAAVWAGRDPDETKLLNEAGRTLGLRVSITTAATISELQTAFDRIKEQRADAIVIGTSPSFVSWRKEIVALAARHAIPAIYARREYVEDGGLISYSPPVTEAYRQVGIYAARILKGAKPTDLPVVQPTKFELSINLKTAKALGIVVPPTMLARADETIE
jgi:putative ABC transport system substrate-binding protein